MEFTRNNENREFRNKNLRNEVIMREDMDGTADFRSEEGDSETDLYTNTITGNQVGAATRNESFDDPDYGATGHRTRKDIMNETENDENQ